MAKRYNEEINTWSNDFAVWNKLWDEVRADKKLLELQKTHLCGRIQLQAMKLTGFGPGFQKAAEDEKAQEEEIRI